MKVVFLQNVPNVARAGEIKKVADGYARNFLIPRKLAILATAGAMSTLEAQIKAESRSQGQMGGELLELAKHLEGSEIMVAARTGANERLYGSITTADIATEIESATGFVVDKRKIELEEPIRQLGSYEIDIRLAKEIVPKIRVTVTEKAD